MSLGFCCSALSLVLLTTDNSIRKSAQSANVLSMLHVTRTEGSIPVCAVRSHLRFTPLRWERLRLPSRLLAPRPCFTIRGVAVAVISVSFKVSRNRAGNLRVCSPVRRRAELRCRVTSRDNARRIA